MRKSGQLGAPNQSSGSAETHQAMPSKPLVVLAARRRHFPHRSQHTQVLRPRLADASSASRPEQLASSFSAVPSCITN